MSGGQAMETCRKCTRTVLRLCAVRVWVPDLAQAVG